MADRTLRWSLIEAPAAQQRTTRRVAGVHSEDGIFGKERCWLFYHCLLVGASDIFNRLWKMTMRSAQDHSTRQRLWHKGLDLVNEWTAKEMDGEVQQLRARFPELLSHYRYTLLEYVDQLFRNDDRLQNDEYEIVVKSAPFDSFYRLFLGELVTYSCVRDRTFLSKKGSSSQKHAVTTAIRVALAESGVGEVKRKPETTRTLPPPPSQGRRLKFTEPSASSSSSSSRDHTQHQPRQVTKSKPKPARSPAKNSTSPSQNPEPKVAPTDEPSKKTPENPTDIQPAPVVDQPLEDKPEVEKSRSNVILVATDAA